MALAALVLRITASPRPLAVRRYRLPVLRR
jgi:hypothetical protein